MNISETSNIDSPKLSKEEITRKLANGIREQLKKYKTYTFRPVRIDGVYCYAVIHRKSKIVNFESIHIICHVDIGDAKKMTQKYSLLYKKYKTIENAIEIVENIVANYKIYNGDLVSPDDYKLLKLEENIIPYEEHQKCCVCLENTQETTTCKHYICFHCRDKCISTQTLDCPICRNPGVMRIFNIDNSLINNDEYVVLRDAVDYEYTSESSSESENSEETTTETTVTDEQDDHNEHDETHFTHHVYRFPMFSTPNIFSSPSTESFDDIFIFPFMRTQDNND
jgi:hypothetical protein